FHVAGLSLGGAVSQWLAVHESARVRSAVLMCTAAKFGEPSAWLERAATVRADGTAAVADAVAARWVTPARAEREPELLASLRAMVVATPAEGYASCCDALSGWDGRADLARIACPTTVVAGDEDPSTPPEVLREIADGVAGSEFVLLSPAAHVPAVESPERVTEVLRAHLAAAAATARARPPRSRRRRGGPTARRGRPAGTAASAAPRACAPTSRPPRRPRELARTASGGAGRGRRAGAVGLPGLRAVPRPRARRHPGVRRRPAPPEPQRSGPVHRADPGDRAAVPPHTGGTRVRRHRRLGLLAHAASPRPGLQLPVRDAADRPGPAPSGATQFAARGIILGGGPRRPRHRLRRARAGPADHDHRDHDRHPLPRLRHVDGQGPARRATGRRARHLPRRDRSPRPHPPRARRPGGPARRARHRGRTRLVRGRPGARAGSALDRRARPRPRRQRGGRAQRVHARGPLRPQTPPRRARPRGPRHREVALHRSRHRPPLIPAPAQSGEPHA